MSTDEERRSQVQQAQQRQQLVAWIEQSVHAINGVLQVLDPDDQLAGEDDVELSFSDFAVGMFKSNVGACQKSLAGATSTVDAWDKLVDAHLIENSNELTKVQVRLGELAAEKEKQTKSATALGEEVKKAESIKNEGQQDYDKAFKAHSEASERLTQLKKDIKEREEALDDFWVRLSNALALADGANPQYEYNKETIKIELDAKKTEETKNGLKNVLDTTSISLGSAISKWNAEVAALAKTNAALTVMATEKEALTARTTSLEADSKTTKALKLNTYKTKDTIGKALGYGGAIDIGMSLTCVRDNIKNLLQALGQESSFVGLLATVDASRLSKLDKAIVGMNHLLQ